MFNPRAAGGRNFELLFLKALLIASGLVLAFGLQTAKAQEDVPVGKIAATMGQSFVLRNGERVAVSKGMEVYRADQLVTSANSVVRLVFADGSSIIALKESSFEIEEYQTRAAGKKLGLDSVVGLVRGKIRVLVKPRDGGHNAIVKTKNAVMGVRGTEFFVSQEGNEGEDKVTNLVVLKGAVAFAPLDDEGNVVEAPHSPSGEAAPEVLVMAGQESRIVAQSAATPPVAAPIAKVTSLANESQSITKGDALSDAEITKSMVLPPPPSPSLPALDSSGTGGLGAGESRLLRKNRERFLALDPAAEDSRAKGAQGVPLPASGSNSSGSSSQDPSAAGASGNAGSARTIVVVPRSPVLLSELGLTCSSSSLERLRSAATLMDPETMTIGNQLVTCDELQDEAYFWMSVYLRVRGESMRASDVTKGHPSAVGVLDVVTPREHDLKLFRKKDVAEILRRAGRSKDRDRSRVVLAARAAALGAKWDQALPLYDEVLGKSSLLSKTPLRLEKIYVLLLKGDGNAARQELERLDRLELEPWERQAVTFAFEAAERGRLDAKPVDLAARAFARVESSSDRWGRREFGLGWQGQRFAVESALGHVDFANVKAPSPDTGGAGSTGRFETQDQNFGYARLGVGARTVFSTGARAAVHGDFYGKEKAAWGARLWGEYPWAGVWVASLDVATFPQFVEFLSSTDQMDHQVWKLGWGLRGYEYVEYKGNITSRSSEGSGGTTLVNGLRGSIPLHRTGVPNKALDVVLEAKAQIQTEATTAFYAPKREIRFGGGAHWRWSFLRSLDLGVEAVLGYVSRESFAESSSVPNGVSRSSVSPWIERAEIPTALAIDARVNASYAVLPNLKIALESSGAFEQAFSEPDAKSADPSSPSPEPSDKAKNPSHIQAMLGVQWNYGNP